MSEKLAYYPLLGEWGPVGPDYMAEQIYQITGEFPCGDEPVSPSPYWKTRDGSLVLITSMTDTHLRNALRLTERKRGEPDSRLVTEWSRRGHADDGWKVK